MKEISLRERLVRFLQKNHGWISSGELQRLVVTYTNHTPRSAVRRLQEAAEDGTLERKLIKNHTHYKIHVNADIDPSRKEMLRQNQINLKWFDNYVPA